MRVAWLSTSLALSVSVLLFSASCDSISSPLSCARKDASGQIDKCIEVYDFNAATLANAKAGISVLCEALGADVHNGQCNTTGAFFGCIKDTDAWTTGTWYYPTTAKPAPESTSCGADGDKVDANRQPFTAQADMSAATDLTSHD